jgi:hypothetical protein
MSRDEKNLKEELRTAQTLWSLPQDRWKTNLMKLGVAFLCVKNRSLSSLQPSSYALSIETLSIAAALLLT